MKLATTERIQSVVDQWKQTNQITEAQIGDRWIDHKLLAHISKSLGLPLTELVRGSGVYFEPPEPKPAKSPEYIAFMDKLRAEAQEKEYRELAGLRDEAGPMFGGSDAKQVKEELTTILNFAVSVFAVGFALWYWARWWDPASRTLLAFFGSLVVLVAEIVVYASYRSKVEEARRIENTKKHISKPLSRQDDDSLLLTEKLENKSKTPNKNQPRTHSRGQAKNKASHTVSTTGSQNPTTLHPRLKSH